MSFLAELRRRNVYRVAAVYAIIAWLLIQIASATFPQLQLPDWAPTLVTVLLMLGFPIALVLAWAFELTPDGPKRTRDETTAGAARRSGRLVDYVLIAGVVAITAVALSGRFADESERSVGSPGRQTASIAVLPFEDMSPNHDQEYFGDGIAEELLNGLMRLDGLNVAGRASSFSFKDSNASPQQIGAALGVGAILNGSVRKDGDRLRITAELVDTDSGYRIWNDTYDRELEDIFSVQEEIASAVTGELGVRLGVGDINAFAGSGTRNVDAFESYLRGIDANMKNDSANAIMYLDRAIELDPDYAAAWAARGIVTATTMWAGWPEEAPAVVAEARRFVSHAVELDPTSGQAQSVFGTILYAGFEWSRAEEFHLRALSLQPDDREVLSQNANMLMRTGRLDAAREQYAAAVVAESLNGRPPNLNVYLAIAQGQFAEARELAAWPNQTPRLLVEIDIVVNEGDPQTIKSALAAVPSTFVQSALYEPVLRGFESPESVMSTLRSVYADDTLRWPSKLHDVAMLAAYFGDAELALRAKAEEARYAPVRFYAMWYPVMSEVRQLPGFKRLVSDMNLVEYWRAYGWPDICRPVGDSDFTCR